MLISKLMAPISKANTIRLKYNLYMTGRIKSDNEENCYIIEASNNVINEGKWISFCYTDYYTQKERVLKTKDSHMS